MSCAQSCRRVRSISIVMSLATLAAHRRATLRAGDGGAGCSPPMRLRVPAARAAADHRPAQAATRPRTACRASLLTFASSEHDMPPFPLPTASTPPPSPDPAGVHQRSRGKRFAPGVAPGRFEATSVPRGRTSSVEPPACETADKPGRQRENAHPQWGWRCRWKRECGGSRWLRRPGDGCRIGTHDRRRVGSNRDHRRRLNLVDGADRAEAQTGAAFSAQVAVDY